jgi:hypothetical protein
MREILFKGFHKCENGIEKAFVNGEWHTGEWKYGFYVELYDTDNNLYSAIECIKPNTHKKEFTCIHVYDYPVIPETVSQFTGLIDKSGKKIFEGDIVNCYEYECCGKIIYSEDGAGFYFLVALEEGGFEDEHLYDYAGELSIVGNIFDNPKLLEVTND